MHQAIVECFTLKQSKLPLEELSKVTLQPPRKIDNTNRPYKDATIRLYPEGTIQGVEGFTKLTLPFDPSCYAHEPEVDLESDSQEPGTATLAHTEPELPPFEPRLLYTPSDTTFLDATLQLHRPTTPHVSSPGNTPYPFPLPSQRPPLTKPL